MKKYTNINEESLPQLNISTLINPLSAKLFRGSINIYLHFMSLLHIDMTHVHMYLKSFLK